MKEHPLFTVIITTYNAEKFVGRAIECVLNQTCQDFELIVANDGSPGTVLRKLRPVTCKNRTR